MAQPRILPPRTGCECTGHGYAVFACDGEGHSPFELQRIDSCLCLGLRLGMPEVIADKASDTDAAILFVYDLEQGDAFARSCALELLGLDEPSDVEESLPTCPGCGEPAHASETDDDGYHEGCRPKT